MGAVQQPLLRLYWPEGLAAPPTAPSNGPVQLIGRCAQQGLQCQVLVTGAQQGGGEAVGVLLPAALPAAAAPQPSSGLRVVLHPSEASSQPLPIVLPPASGAAPTPPQGPRTRGAAAAAAAAADPLQQHAVHCQVVLYARSDPPQLASHGGGPSSGAALAGPRRRPVLARLACRAVAALPGALLLAHWRGMAHAAGSGGERLARFAAAQLAWSMAAQPAGVKLHRQLAELLGLAWLQYLNALRALLAGHACVLVGGAAALLAAALVVAGLQRGLVALDCLLWAAGLPAAAPYATMAAALRWQLRSTALMWGVMRGKQQLPPLRKRLARALRRASGGAGGGPAAAPGGAPGPAAAGLCSFPRSPGSGLKQLSGSMLLFMPLLLLLPTTAWFYALALALHAAAAAPRAAVQLAAALVGQDPLGAALGQLLAPCRRGGSRCTSSSTSAGGADLEYRVLDARLASRPALPAWAAQAAAEATYLRACRRGGSPWQAAGAAAARAWRRCAWAGARPLAVLRAALCGRPLLLPGFAPTWRQLTGPHV